MVPRMPVPSGVEVAAPRMPSAVSRADTGGSGAARGARAQTVQSHGASHGFTKVTQVKAGGVTFGGPALVVIAGPCVIESDVSCLRHAEKLAAISRSTGVPLVFKSSFDKANRTSHASFRGPGLDPGTGGERSAACTDRFDTDSVGPRWSVCPL